jgi:hypothetical protein
MNSPCAVNLHLAVTCQQRLGKRVARLSSARMNEVCAALRFSLGCDASLVTGNGPDCPLRMPDARRGERDLR